MFLIHAYPLARGTPIQSLTYFSRVDYPRGSLIDVSIRRVKTPAIVSRVEPLSAARSSVRRAEHTLASIPAQEPRTIFLPAFLDAIERVAAASVGTPGAILHSMLPAPLLFDKGLTFVKTPDALDKSSPADSHFEQLLLQAHRTERKAELRTLVRERFARKQSVLIVVPNPRETTSYADILGSGLEAERAIIFHSALTTKQMREVWGYAAQVPGPILFVTTPSGLGLPRNDFGIIIVEHENAGGYVREVRPNTDVRDVAESYARTLSIPYLTSGALVRMQSLYRLKQHEAAEYRPLRTRARTNAHIQIADMRAHKATPRGEYQALSDELIELVKRVEREQSHLFILSGRRGLASSVVCGDCGTTVLCARCEAPVSLHARKGENVFLCHHCNTMGESAARCGSCSSWKLVALGSGSELTEKQLSRGTKLPIFRIDSDSAKSPKMAARIAQQAAGVPSILIGTELALPYLPDALPYSAITAIDSLLGVADFALEERLYALLLATIERTEREVVIQARNPEHRTLKAAASGDVRGFQERELAARRDFSFPPYAALVSISRFGPKAVVTKDVAKLASKLAPYKPALLPAQKGAQRGTKILIQIPREKWPDQDLLSMLRALTPQWDIQIRT